MLLCSCLVVAQEENFIFKNYTEKDGIGDNFVFCVHKGKTNIIWIGTQNGLTRFDGKNFYNFKHQKESNSIPNNTIQSLCEDADGNIWGGTNKGIFFYDVKKNLFVHYNAPSGCFSNQITNIIFDGEGNIFATTSVELLTFNSSIQKFELTASLYNNDADRINALIWKNGMIKDEKSEVLWIATLNGLFRYDLKNKKLYLPDNSSQEFTRPDVMARALTPLADGSAVFFDNKKKDLIFFDPANAAILNKINLAGLDYDVNIIAIIEDSKNKKLWLSSLGNKIYVFDLTNSTFKRVPSNKNNEFSIISDFFWDGFIDENGSVWLGTFSGISVCSPDFKIFKPLNLPELIPYLKSNILIIGSQPSTDNMYLYTDKDQVMIINLKQKEYTIYPLEKFVPSRTNELPSWVYNFHFFDNKILIATDAGIWQFIQDEKIWKPYNLLPQNYGPFVTRLMIAGKTEIYVSDGTDILAINKKTARVSRIYSRADGPKDGIPVIIHYLMLDTQDNLYWAANKLYIGHFKENKPIVIKVIEDPSLVNVGIFRPVIMDKNDNIWIGFKGIGIYRYNTKNGTMKNWTEFDGWATSHTHCLVENPDGNIWTAYFNKISYFNQAQESFINFSIPYSENNFNYPNSLIRNENGDIFTVVGDDVFQLLSSDLNKSPKEILPAFNAINISGKDFFLTGDSTFVLEPDQNAVQFKFGILLDPIAFPHIFEYKLEGFDKEWKQPSVLSFASYNNLQPGKYTFKVRVKGLNNAWLTGESKISLSIKGYLYQNIYFRIGLIILLLSLMFLFYRFRMRQQASLLKLQSKAHHLEKEKAQMMFDSLKQQLNPHFLFNSLTSLSALINADQRLASDFLGQMSDMYRYILMNGDAETVSLQEELKFVESYYKLQKTRFGSGLHLNLNVDEGLYSYRIAPVTLQNLMENAIKHNIIDRDEPLIIDIYTEGEYLVVKNNSQPKSNVETSNKKGLVQFKTLYKYLTIKTIEIESTDAHFIIKIPLIQNT